jgi:fibronectin type 3 domain-containing protein
MFRLWASNAPPQSITLAWDPSPSTNIIANYNVYYGSLSATYTNVVAAGTNTTVSIFNLVDSTTYYFATTAVDTSGLESDYSTEVSALIPVRLSVIPVRLRIQWLP